MKKIISFFWLDRFLSVVPMIRKHSLVGGAILDQHFLVRTLVVFLLLGLPLLGQVGRSGVTGTIIDPTGAVVPNAKVTAKNESTNLEWSTTTGDTGAYFIRNLPVGRYTVTAEADGFKKVIVGPFDTEVEKVSTVDVSLTVGEMTQTVEVAAEAGLLTTTSGTVGNLVTRKEIETLPLNGRSWINLNYLTPGSVKFRGTSMNFSNITESVAPGGFVVNGLRGGNNLFFIDGVNLQNVEDQIHSILPTLDALQEFRTQTGNPTAEYFGGAAAMVSATTKSGTNEIHGSVWEFLRNDVFDARNFFDRTVPPFKRNQFGFTLGGPIKKDRTFAFGSYEGFRQRKGVTVVGDFPTEAQRSGNLSDFSGQIVDPLTRQPFPGNIIPSNRIHPLSASWLRDWIPLPSDNVPIGQGNFRRSPSQPIDYDSLITRVDHRLNQKSSLFGRYMYTKTTSLAQFILPTMTRPQTRDGHNLAVQYTNSLSPNSIVEARFGFHRYFLNEEVGNSRDANMLTELGVLGKPGFTDVVDSQLSPPRITVTGYSPFAHTVFGRPRTIFNRSFYYDGLFFVTRGGHAIKAGGGLVNNRANFPEIINPTGNWSYNGFFSGSPLADFLLGYPRSVSTIPDLFEPSSRRWGGGVWFQDDWKVTPKLNLNLGLRWDVDPRYYSATDTVANYDLSTPPTAVLVTPQNRPNGWDRALVDGPQFNLFAPRFGFAYRIFDQTVVRGGYGIYWQPMTADPFVNISINLPFVRNLSATYDFVDLPTFDRTNPLKASSAAAAGANAIQKDFTDAYVQQWNMTLEHTIGDNLLSIGYVGNKGTHLVNYLNPNLAQPGPGPIQPRRPYTNLGGFQYHDSSRDSNYHGMHLKAQRRFARGLSFVASYAWGRAINTGDGSYIESQSIGHQQPLNPRAERSLAEYDVRHALTFSYIYSLPLARNLQGVGGKFINGWQIQGITRLLSGSPFSIFNAFDNLNNGGSGYPNRACDPTLEGGRSSGEKVAQFFNTSCFVTPTLYAFGNAGRNIVTGPGTQLWDFALQKNTNLGQGERYRLEFKAEFFNAFNHPNFANPNNSFGSPQFGRISSVSENGRSLQFGLKFVF